METVKGSKLNITLDVSLDNQLVVRELANISGDRFSKVEFFRDGQTYWEGWLKPDEIFQSFVFDRYEVQLTAVDGLGFLDKISYLDPNGLPYTGNENELIILTRCLNLTGFSNQILIHNFELYFAIDNVPPTLSQRALIETYVNQDRYVNDDQSGTVFTCKQVIDGILKKYGATIFWKNNRWEVQRIIEFYDNTTASFTTEWTSDGQFIANGLVDKDFTIGSQINGFDPFHSGGSQALTFKGSLGAYKVFYKYGFVQSIIENSKVIWNSQSFADIDNWTVLNSSNWGWVPSESRYGFRPRLRTSGSVGGQLVSTLQSVPSAQTSVDEGLVLFVKFEGELTFNWGAVEVYGQIILSDGTQTQYLDETGWTTSPRYLFLFGGKTGVGGETINFSADFTTPNVPFDGEIRVVFSYPIWTPGAPGQTVRTQDLLIFREITVNGQVDTNIDGESFTATRISNPTTITESDDNVFVGDNFSDVYIGAIEDINNDNTLQWGKRKAGNSVVFPPFRKLLDFLVRDRLVMESGNRLEFQGGVFGFVPFGSMLRIDGFDDCFFILDWSFDPVTNVTEMTSVRIFNDPSVESDINVEFKLEGGTVIEPQIVG